MQLAAPLTKWSTVCDQLALFDSALPSNYKLLLTTSNCQANYCKLPSRKNSALLLCARIVSIALLQLHLVFVCVPKMSAHRYVNHSCHPIPDLHSSVTVLERHQMSYPSISVPPRCSLALIKMERKCIISW